MAEKIICHLNCPSLALSLFLTVFLFLLPPAWSGQAVRLWPQEAVNSLPSGRCLTERRDRPPPLHRHRHLGPPRPPTHLRITPDLFLCLYQSVEVRNTDESLWMCVYTPESRKEGNQPRSAKSGEVTENSCSVPELCTRFFYFTKATLISRCLTCEGFLSKDGRICRSEPFVKEMTKLMATQ